MAAQQRQPGDRPGARRKSMVFGVVVAAALGALFFSAFTAFTDTSVEAPAERQRVAYLADWNVANRGYSINDFVDSGAADRLDRLQWAFGDVSEDGLCHIPENSNQPWEMYQRRYSAQDSVDGVADEYDQPLAGSLNQLRKAQETRPDLGASISLGGWNWSTYFSDAVRSKESRERFVSSCIDLWLRGDLPTMNEEPQGGEGAAKGIFDGIDLDWEWPGGDGKEGNIERADDKRRFTLVVQEFRDQLTDLEAETGQDYTLSVSLGNSQDLMEASYEPEVFTLVDFATVQGYDFTGSWSDVTDHHSQLHAPDGAPTDASVANTVQNYLDFGLPPEKVIVGFPGYGRGWEDVSAGDFGRFSSAGGAAEGGYGKGTDSYADLEGLDGQRFHDPLNGAYWLYNGDEWWSYDTPEVVRQKGRYVRDEGLGGLMLWNLDMDPNGELVTAMDESLRGG